MAWFKVDDGFFSSKPVLRIARRYRLPAVGLWTLAGTWSAQEELDGFVPDYVLEELCGTPAIAAQLVSAGLWENVESSNSERGLAGWQFRNWSKYQPTKAELDETREKERVRKAKYRASQRDTDGTSAGQTEGHHPESEHPDPTRPDPTPKTPHGVSRTAKAELESAFAEAWSHWPKKVDRKQAFDRFVKATKRLEMSELVSAIVRFGDAYAATTEVQFVPALGVWIGRDRWTDELPGRIAQGRPVMVDRDAWMQA